MSGTSDFEQNKYLDALLRGQAYGNLANVFVALFKCNKGIIARSTAYATTDYVAVNCTDGRYHLFKCTTAGTTAASQPTTFVGVSNEVVTDGTAVFTEQSSLIEANDAPTLNEITGGAYARVSVACSLTAWSGTQGAGTTVASSGTSAQISNNAVITFPQATANWAASPEAIWGFGLYSASTGGNLIRWGSLTTPVQVLNTNTFSAAAGALLIRGDR